MHVIENIRMHQNTIPHPIIIYMLKFSPIFAIYILLSSAPKLFHIMKLCYSYIMV